MKYIRVAALLTLLLSTTCGQEDEFGGKLLDFHITYNSFVRKYFGCPEKAVVLEDCNPKLGIVDYKLLRELSTKSQIFAIKN